jgi:hypothetical protein
MSASQTLQKHDAIAPTTLRRRFAHVRRQAAACQRCELWERATQTVIGEGPVPARLMFDGLVRDLRVAAKALAVAG